MSSVALGHRVARARLGILGLVLVAAAVAAGLAAPWLAPYSPLAQNLSLHLRGPMPGHLLGTDDLGRDTLSRLVFGARASLVAGAASVTLGLVVGAALGLAAGYWRGWIDAVIMRLVDCFLALPSIVLALTITAALGAGLGTVVLAIGVANMLRFARLVRGQVLQARELDYVEAERALGAGSTRILLRHILPNISAPVIVQFSLSVSYAILIEATLSFLGLGIQPPTPSWGSMIKVGTTYLLDDPWMVLWPGSAIFLTVLGFNVLGDALRDALDPRMRL